MNRAERMRVQTDLIQVLEQRIKILEENEDALYKIISKLEGTISDLKLTSVNSFEKEYLQYKIEELEYKNNQY